MPIFWSKLLCRWQGCFHTGRMRKRDNGILAVLSVGVLPPDVPDFAFSITAAFTGLSVSEGGFRPN